MTFKKSKDTMIEELENQISDAKESVSVLGGAIACGFLQDKHSLILQEWIVEYKQIIDQYETHLTEMRSNG